MRRGSHTSSARVVSITVSLPSVARMRLAIGSWRRVGSSCMRTSRRRVLMTAHPPTCLARPGLRGSGRPTTEGVGMADRAVFIGFGQPVRGREERAVDVFNEFVGMCGRMQTDGRIEDMDVTLLDPHGGD